MDTCFILIIIAILSEYIIKSTSLHSKNAFSYINNDTYWKSVSDFIPINNASYGSIKLGRSLRMEYKFMYNSRAQYHLNNSKDHENAFRIGYSSEISNRADGAGSRYPSMWIYYVNSLPFVKFSISNKENNWKEFGDLYPIQSYQTYSVIIEFNQTNVFISVSNDIVYSGLRSFGTSELFLDSFMNIWIAQFGHDGIATPAANVTMSDIIIVTWDHLVTPSPTTKTTTFSPTISPIASTQNPTMSPLQTIETIVSNQAIELYEFYNETLDEYKDKYKIYESFIYFAVRMAAQNISKHSMDINDADKYTEKEWNYGGIYEMKHCMIFNHKIIENLHVDCPFIPQPHSNEFEYVYVGLLYVESDGYIDAFNEFVRDIMSLDEFGDLFRKYLRQIVVEDQSLFVMDEKQDINNESMMYEAEKMGIIVAVTCFSLCIMMIAYYLRKWYKIKQNKNISNGNKSKDNNSLKTYRKVTISRRKSVKLNVVPNTESDDESEYNKDGHS